MAVVALSDDSNRNGDIDAGTGYSTTNIGGGAAPAQDTVTFYEGTASVSRKVVASGGGGWWMDMTATIDMTATADRVWMCKLLLTDNADLNATGMELRVGSTTGDYYSYLVHDDGSAVYPWPATRSWLVLPIDPNVTAFRYGTTGTPALGTVDEFAVVAALATGGAKSENLFLDEIDTGNGLFLVGGDSTSTDGVWQDFVDYDEGTQANRFGHVITQEGILYVVGKLRIGRTSGGTVTATEFTDSGTVMVFPESRTAAGWNELEFDIGNASTAVTINSNVWTGRGTGAAKATFDTTADVSPTPDTITLDGFIGTLRTGDAVLYSKEGGTAAIGLTDATEYWVYETTTPGDYTIHSSYAAGLAGTGAIALTSTGAETHSFQKQPDTRPDFTITGTSGSYDHNGGSITNFRALTLTSGATLTGVAIEGCDSITGAGVLDGCVIGGATTDDGEAFISLSDPSNVKRCDFTFSDGHAIEIDTAGTYSFDANTFSGYGADATNDAAIWFNPTGGTGNLVLNILNGGDTPTVRNSSTGTVTINNTVTLTVQVNDSDGNAVSGARVRIENASTGAQISQGSTNASGTYTDTTYNYTGDLAVTTKVRLKGYKNFRTGGTIENTGLSVGVTLATDNIVDLP